MSATAAIPADVRTRARRAKQPTWMAPMLATLTERRDLGPEWVYERKYDGIRVLAHKRGDDVHLFSRRKLSLDRDFPDIVDAVREQSVGSMILDGEAAAFRGKQHGFELMQQRGGAGLRMVYVVFDILYVDGYDVTSLALTERKELLRGLLRPTRHLEVSLAKKGDATRLLEQACARGWEGLIAKRADAPYRQARSSDWLKLKCSLEQEFVVGGFSDPKGSRVGLGALLLGVYDGGTLRYAGEVGTGFSHELLRSLRQRLDRIERDASPFGDFAKPRKGIHWVEPRLVVQVGFTEWTRDGRLRHPRFIGERTDKRPRDVVREVPA